ncbi:MAG: monovalent cation/H(+) antiporter subunit G [Solirubrobacteraceae bacterium]
MNVRHLAATILLVAGAMLQVLAVIGVTAMRDALDRLHYVGLAGVGALLIAVAIVVKESFSLIGDKALATGIILLLMGAVVAHATARALRIRELGRWNAQIEEHREQGDDR